MKRFLCALAAGATLSACSGTSYVGDHIPKTAAAPHVAPTLPALVNAGSLMPPSGTIYLGAYVNSDGLPGDNGPTAIGAVESQIGRTLALDLQIHAWTTQFGNRREIDDMQNGRVPIYSWKCGDSNAVVASGADDAALTLAADQVKAFGWPVFVQYESDMNVTAGQPLRPACYDPKTDNPDKTYSATNFIAAWKRIHAIFKAEGATNAVWLWSVSAAADNALAYYPGDDQVDWVGVDAYDTTNGSFADTFSAPYALLSPIGKPIMVSQTGAGATVQQSFFGDALHDLKALFPAIRGFVYYDGIGNPQDWRITNDALPSFSAFANDIYAKGSYSQHCAVAPCNGT